MQLGLIGGRLHREACADNSSFVVGQCNPRPGRRGSKDLAQIARASVRLAACWFLCGHMTPGIGIEIDQCVWGVTYPLKNASGRESSTLGATT